MRSRYLFLAIVTPLLVLGAGCRTTDLEPSNQDSHQQTTQSEERVRTQQIDEPTAVAPAEAQPGDEDYIKPLDEIPYPSYVPELDEEKEIIEQKSTKTPETTTEQPVEETAVVVATETITVTKPVTQEEATSSSTTDSVKAEESETSTGSHSTTETTTSTSEKTEQVVQKMTVSVQVQLPSAQTQLYSVQINSGGTVEDAMQAAEANGLAYNVSSFAGLGAYVKGIASIDEDAASGMYWVYYVNGARATSGISTYTLSPGDTVLWKYRPAGAPD